jgi:hypothetical protein
MNETLYKLTDQNQETQGGTKWGAGVTHRHKICDDPKLCSGDVFHAYRNVNLAFLLNPNHANIKKPILWECKGKVVVSDYGKVGCFSLKVTKRLPAPAWWVNSKNKNLVRATFAILCAEAVLHIYETAYPQDDRPRKAIEAAKEYVKKPSADAAARAAQGADDAYAAARAARAADAADAAALAAALAAHVASDAAALAAALAAERDAARAADDADDAARAADDAERADIDFGALADKAVELLKEMETTK